MKLLKSDIKELIIVQKISISNKCCSFEFEMFLKQQIIIMISKRSSYTDYWSNGS